MARKWVGVQLRGFAHRDFSPLQEPALGLEQGGLPCSWSISWVVEVLISSVLRHMGWGSPALGDGGSRWGWASSLHPRAVQQG